MDVSSKLKSFHSEITKLKDQVSEIIKQRIDWCKENRKAIKAMYPKKGKLYQISKLPDTYWSNDLCDPVYYFRPTYIGFDPTFQFDHHWNDKVFPDVKGQILDCNLKVIEERRLCVTILKEINKKTKDVADRITKIYVMIDKNTGYYKIGRSVNPLRRERTLQSEKPTIELLFHCDARIRDEKTLHDMFKEKRIRGEWFDLTGSDLQAIKKYFDQ